jgi:hypothetical protein
MAGYAQALYAQQPYPQQQYAQAPYGQPQGYAPYPQPQMYANEQPQYAQQPYGRSPAAVQPQYNGPQYNRPAAVQPQYNGYRQPLSRRGALQEVASSVSLADNTRRTVEMFNNRKAQTGLDTIVPIAPVPPPPSLNVGPSDVSVGGVATDFKPGQFVKTRRMVIKQEVVHKVGDKVEGLWQNMWCPAVVAAVNGDGTCTLNWYDVDTTDTVKKSSGEIRSNHSALKITRTFDDTLYNAMVKAKLSDVFKEADADKDGKLTYAEWESRMGKLVPPDELRRLFEECDTDKNGSLDTKEFATGMAGKYEIQWAQVSL